MPRVVTINRPDVITLIEEVAAKMTGGNKTEAVALAMRKLLEREERTGTLFGRHRGSVVVEEGFDPVHASAGWEDHNPEYGL